MYLQTQLKQINILGKLVNFHSSLFVQIYIVVDMNPDLYVGSKICMPIDFFGR